MIENIGAVGPAHFHEQGEFSMRIIKTKNGRTIITSNDEPSVEHQVIESRMITTHDGPEPREAGDSKPKPGAGTEDFHEAKK